MTRRDRVGLCEIAGHPVPQAVERWFTEPTTAYWQDLLPGWPTGPEAEPPFRYGFPVRLPDGRALVLPIRELPNGDGAVASLIANQASLAVVQALATFMGDAARDLGAEIIVGLPTLGLAFAPRVAETLGHPRYVPLGYSRKFWYEDVLSEPVSSITSPGAGKRLFLDPDQEALLRGRRIVIVDDAISTGTTLAAANRLIRRRSLDVAGIVVAMKQSLRWERTLSEVDPALPGLVSGVFTCPRFRRGENGWIPVD